MLKKSIVATLYLLMPLSTLAQSNFDNVSNLQLCIDYINSPASQQDQTQIDRANELSKRNENCQQYVELAKARKANVEPERSFLQKLGEALSGAGAGAPNTRPSVTTNCRQMGREWVCESR